MKPMKPYCHPALREASILFCLMNCVVAATIAFAVVSIRGRFMTLFDSGSTTMGLFTWIFLVIPDWAYYAMSIMVIGLLVWKERRMHSAKALLLNGAVLFVMVVLFTGTWVSCVLRLWLQIMANTGSGSM